MHEAGAAEALVKMVLEALPGPGTRVTAVNLVVGKATGYMESSLNFYFGVLSKGSRAEGARLSVRYVAPLLLCPSCQESFERRRFSFECPRCGAVGRISKVGNEFYVDSIEVGPIEAVSACG